MQLLSKSQKNSQFERIQKQVFSSPKRENNNKELQVEYLLIILLQWNLEIWLKMIHCYQSVMKNRVSFYFCSEYKWTREHRSQHWKWYLYIWLGLMIYARVKNRSVVKGFSQNHTSILKLVLTPNSLLQRIAYKLIIISNPLCIGQR